MSWCDKLASTPTVGVKLSPFVTSGDALFDALSPVINNYVVDGKLTINVERHDTTSIAFNTDVGLRYGVDHSSVSIAFNHRLKANPVSGGLPELQMLSTPAPYTHLLPNVSEKLVEAAILLPKFGSRSITRFGIVSSTAVSEDDLPPGVRRFVEYFSRPWAEKIDNYSFLVVANVAEGDGWTDSCIHNIVKPEDQSALLTINFDYGRKFDDEKIATEDRLRSISRDVRKDALSYFEEMAEGSRFDERIIGAKG